jgi:hypothetical protein
MRIVEVMERREFARLTIVIAQTCGTSVNKNATSSAQDQTITFSLCGEVNVCVQTRRRPNMFAFDKFSESFSEEKDE